MSTRVQWLLYQTVKLQSGGSLRPCGLAHNVTAAVCLIDPYLFFMSQLKKEQETPSPMKGPLISRLGHAYIQATL